MITMKKKTSKYRIIKAFDSKSKAVDYMNQALEKQPSLQISVKSRIWIGKDKSRHYVRELTRRGSKCTKA